MNLSYKLQKITLADTTEIPLVFSKLYKYALVEWVSGDEVQVSSSGAITSVSGSVTEGNPRTVIDVTSLTQITVKSTGASVIQTSLLK
jgi:hypothetical protein